MPFLSLVSAYIIVLAYCLILMIESKKGGIWPTFNLPSITKNRKELGHIFWLDTSVNSIFIGKLSVLWSKREDVKLYAINLINGMIQYDNYALGCCHTKRLIHLWLHQMFDYAEWCKIFIVCSRSFETVEQKKHSPKDFKASWDQIRKKRRLYLYIGGSNPFFSV